MSMGKGQTPATVVVIEDDSAVRESLEGLFKSVGLGVGSFASADEFYASSQSDDPGCMVLDVRLPGKSGLELYDDLVKSGRRREVVFISGHADIPMSVRAMKAGAVEFLTKPVRDQDLLDAVKVAIERDRVRREDAAHIAAIKVRFEGLTDQERLIMALLVRGSQNPEIALELRKTEASVDRSRIKLMAKMQVDSLAQLVRLSDLVAQL